MNGKNGSNTSEELRKKTILVVNTGSIKKRFILQQLKKIGCRVIVLHKEKNWAQPYVDDWILADTNNFKECIVAVKEYLKNNQATKLDGICTFWEDDVLLTSKLTDTFNLIGIPYRVAQKARNKYLFREFCQNNGIKSPKHTLLKSAEDCRRVTKEFAFPLVVKPAYGSSSAYVVKVDNEEDLVNTYDYIKRNISTEIESALANGLEILVEEYIDGNEVDVDILLQNGKIKFYSITDNFQTKEPFFVETGDAIPSSLPAWEQRSLVSLAEEVLEKLEIQNGCIHFEAKATKDGPVPIEVNLRMGGDYVHSFVKGAWGVDLIENAVKIACGIYIGHIPKPERPLKFLSGKYFIPDYSGILAKLDIEEDLKKNSDIEEVSFYKKIGDPVLVPPEGYEFLGWLTASGENPIDTQDNIRDLSRAVDYEVARFNRDSFIGKTVRKNRFSAALLNKDILLRAAKKENIKLLSTKDLRSLRIGVAYNFQNPNEQTSDTQDFEAAQECEKALKSLGYHVNALDCNIMTKLTETISADEVNLVFNIKARILGSEYGEIHAASLFDMLDVPYTGADSVTLGVCRDVSRIKKLLQFHNIPTARWDYIYELTDEIRDDFRYPVIIKPMYDESVINIGQDFIVRDKDSLHKKSSELLKSHKEPLLIEEFIEGDEYHAVILGNDNSVRALPLTRFIFNSEKNNGWPVYQNVTTGQDIAVRDDFSVQRPPKNISKKLESLITEIALDTYNVLEFKDYGLIKIRVDKDQNPYVISVDPLPSLGEKGDLAVAASLVGLNHGALLEEIIRFSIMRYKEK